MPSDRAVQLTRELADSLREKPLDIEETATLTIGLARSGQLLSWTDEPQLHGKTSVDLPSTGGNGNKTPIIVPLLALAAARDRIFVPKFSSRGRVAGTIDILESVGYQANVSANRYRQIVASTGLSNVVQSPEFAPADGRLMQLRRRAGAMNIPELVVSSVLAKKVASGCRNVVVDLKAGQDSKFGDLAGVIAGARLFSDVGSLLRKQGHLDGLWVCCTNGYRPQGRALGRLASLWEASRVLAGLEDGFLSELSVGLAARMLVLAGAARNIHDAAQTCRDAIGAPALEAARAWLHAHGARTDFLDEPDLLLRGVDQDPFVTINNGVLMTVDVGAIEAVITQLAACPGGGNAAGLVFAEDPSPGRSLETGFHGSLWTPVGTHPAGDQIQSAIGAIKAYCGRQTVINRPDVLHERAVGPAGLLQRSCWTRTSQAAIAVIRRCDGQVLLVFNRKWDCWNLPAGHYEPDRDQDFAAAIARELSEELGPELGEPEPKVCRHFTIQPRRGRCDVWRSGATGEWTYYDFQLFTADFVDPSWLDTLVLRHPGTLCWASLDELRRGRLANDASVAVFPATHLALEGDIGD